MKFTVEIASVPDRSDVVSEIWWGDAMVAELRRDPCGGAAIEIYPSNSQSPWTFDLTEWLSALDEAKRKLGCRPLGD